MSASCSLYYMASKTHTPRTCWKAGLSVRSIRAMMMVSLLYRLPSSQATTGSLRSSLERAQQRLRIKARSLYHTSKQQAGQAPKVRPLPGLHAHDPLQGKERKAAGVSPLYSYAIPIYHRAKEKDPSTRNRPQPTEARPNARTTVECESKGEGGGGRARGLPLAHLLIRFLVHFVADVAHELALHRKNAWKERQALTARRNKRARPFALRDRNP